MSSFYRSALLGGLLCGLLAIAIQVADTLINDFIDILNCLVFIGSGILAVRYYHSVTGAISGGTGVGLGAVAGAICGFLVALTALIIMQAGIGASTADVMEAVESTGALEGPAGGFVRAVVEYIWVPVFLAMTAVGSVLGLAGGAIGWGIWKEKGPAPDLGGPGS